MREQQENGRVCQLPECEKALVGTQRKYCSLKHNQRAFQRRSGRRWRQKPNGFLCRFPGCGNVLVGEQKSYCSAVHMRKANADKLMAFRQTERGHLSDEKGRRRSRAMYPELSFKQRHRYQGLVLPLNDVDRAAEIRAQIPEIQRKRQQHAALTNRLNHGELLRCPRCGSRDTKRHGKAYLTGKPQAQCRNLTCGKIWTIGKDYTKLICSRCGSDDTKKGGFDRHGCPLGYCHECKRNRRKYIWTIGKDYGTPFTPAMVGLLQNARTTELTPEEKEWTEGILRG